MVLKVQISELLLAMQIEGCVGFQTTRRFFVGKRGCRTPGTRTHPSRIQAPDHLREAYQEDAVMLAIIVSRRFRRMKTCLKTQPRWCRPSEKGVFYELLTHFLYISHRASTSMLWCVSCDGTVLVFHLNNAHCKHTAYGFDAHVKCSGLALPIRNYAHASANANSHDTSWK